MIVSDTLTDGLTTLDQTVSVTAAGVWLTGPGRTGPRRRRSDDLR